MTITPAELRTVLDILSRAQVSLGEAYQVRNTLDKLVAMASGTEEIGPRYVPIAVEPDRA